MPNSPGPDGPKHIGEAQGVMMRALIAGGRRTRTGLVRPHHVKRTPLRWTGAYWFAWDRRRLRVISVRTRVARACRLFQQGGFVVTVRAVGRETAAIDLQAYSPELAERYERTRPAGIIVAEVPGWSHGVPATPAWQRDPPLPGGDLAGVREPRRAPPGAGSSSATVD